MQRVLSFKAEEEIVQLIEQEAEKQFCSVSAVLRQIVHGHYKRPSNDIPEGTKTSPEESSSGLSAL